MEQKRKEEEHKMMINGHPFVNEQLVYIRDWVVNLYTDIRVIDVSNVLTQENYKAIQLEHYHSKHGKTVMLAFRNERNDNVFYKRSPRYTNVMFMFRGAYQVFNDFSFGNMTSQLKKMIDLRINDEDYNEETQS